MDNAFSIPILYKNRAGNLHQNEVMNLLAFIKEFHPLPLVDEAAFTRFEAYAASLCDRLDERMERPAFQVELNRWLALLRDAHTFLMLDDTSLYPFTLRYYEGRFYFRSLPNSVSDCNSGSCGALLLLSEPVLLTVLSVPHSFLFCGSGTFYPMPFVPIRVLCRSYARSWSHIGVNV